MQKLVIAIEGSLDPSYEVPRTNDKDKANKIYKDAVKRFSKDGKDMGVEKMEEILKLISTLIEAKENDTGKIDTDIREQTEPRNEGKRLFE